jgi:Protein of unknown function (DUF4038)
VVSYITGASADGTYLVDQNGQPKLLVNESVWGMPPNAVASWSFSGNYQTTFDTYFSDRAAQGNTTAEVSLLSCGDPNEAFIYTTGQDADGAWPFNGNNDPTTTPNSTFWARRDYMFTSAQSNGITVVCNFPGVGPSSPCASWTTAQWTAYGTFLGNRYKSQPNIIWIAGDGTFGSYDAGLASWRTAVRAAGDTHLISYQANNEQSSRYGFDGSLYNDPDAFSIYAELDWVYTYNVTYNGVIYSIKNEPSGTDVIQGRIPVVWGDGNYLGSSGGNATQSGPHLMQNFIWWAMSSGACGYSCSSNDIFAWASGEPANVTTNGGAWYTSTMPAISSYIQGLNGWWKLHPDGLPGGTRTLVTSGGGSPTAIGSNIYYTSNTDSYVTAAYAADGTLAVIYCGLHYSITIDQTKMAPGYTAAWVDPASCAVTSTTAGSTYNSTPLGNNSAGYADWVLVLQAPSSYNSGPNYGSGQATSGGSGTWSNPAYAEGAPNAQFATWAVP